MERVRRPFKIFSVLVFLTVIGMTLKANWEIFLQVIGLVVFVVMIHNLLAPGPGLRLGQTVQAAGAGRAGRDTIEVGIQNAALGLILIFNFFEGLGGMAIIAAWWGVWHLIAGLTVAFFWSRREAGETGLGRTQGVSG